MNVVGIMFFLSIYSNQLLSNTLLLSVISCFVQNNVMKIAKVLKDAPTAVHIFAFNYLIFVVN